MPFAVLSGTATLFCGFHVAAIHLVGGDRIAFFDELTLCFWVMASAIWMFGELFFDDQLRRLACIAYVFGILVFFVYFIFRFYFGIQSAYYVNFLDLEEGIRLPEIETR